MATLASLKLVSAQKPTHVPDVQARRNKLAKRIWEQAQLAKAQLEGSTFAPTKLRTVVDAETGSRKQVEFKKRVKPWWFTTENGKLAVSIAYGPRVLELAKGKFSVELTDERELVAVLDTIKSAVLAGELDAAMAAASAQLRAAFSR